LKSNTKTHRQLLFTHIIKYQVFGVYNQSDYPYFGYI
jgi:hypothetical protein